MQLQLLVLAIPLIATIAARPDLLKAVVHFSKQILDYNQKQLRDAGTLENSYDYIVVGGGTAGCAVAGRLAESSSSVLLLEAGSSESLPMDIPLLVNFLQRSSFDWSYSTEPSMRACLALEEGRCRLPRGKVLGGSSVLNYMIFNRGHRLDYDAWENAGNSGWSYKHILPYFKKLESLQIRELETDCQYRGTTGPVKVAYPPFRSEIANVFVRAAIETGLDMVDYNSNRQTGVSFIQATISNGTRWSSSTAYLNSPLVRRHLHLKLNSRVTRILITNNKADGVEFIQGNRIYTSFAKKEVIVSAGTINSPQILMLSGIGPKRHLRSLGIELKQTLPVGNNLIDHIGLSGLTFLINESISLRLSDLVYNSQSFIDYVYNRQGPLSIPGCSEAVAFYDLQTTNQTNGYPELEILFISCSFATIPGSEYTMGIDKKIFNEIYGPIKNRYSWTALPIVLRPKSKGKIRLRSKNPFDKPFIFTNYLDNEYDLNIILSGIRKAQEISRTKAMQQFNSNLHDLPVPGCRDYPFDSDIYWKCAIRHMTTTIYHQVGTCAMGPKGVVDSRLRVRGIQKLRVVDASIMPKIPAAHINAAVYMIAEKAADMIIADSQT